MPVQPVLAWSSSTWSVIIAAIGAAISIASVGAAAYSARHSRRSADAASRSADSAERSVDLQKEALELERNRASREQLETIKTLGPSWEAAEDGVQGQFVSDGQQLSGRIRNAGLMTATVLGAWLDYNGQRAVLRTRCDTAQGGGGWASRVFVPPQGVLELQGDQAGIDLAGDARPTIYIDYEQLGTDTGLLGVTIELLREGSSPSGDACWRVGRIRSGLLP